MNFPYGGLTLELCGVRLFLNAAAVCVCALRRGSTEPNAERQTQSILISTLRRRAAERTDVF